MQGEAGPKGKLKDQEKEVKELLQMSNFPYRVRTYPNSRSEWRRKERPSRRIASMRYT